MFQSNISSFSYIPTYLFPTPISYRSFRVSPCPINWFPSPFGQLACIKQKAEKFQTGNTFPKQYWLAVNGKLKTMLYAYIFVDLNTFQVCERHVNDIRGFINSFSSRRGLSIGNGMFGFCCFKSVFFVNICFIHYSSVQFIGISAYVHAFDQSINSKTENDGQGNQIHKHINRIKSI